MGKQEYCEEVVNSLTEPQAIDRVSAIQATIRKADVNFTFPRDKTGEDHI